MRLGFFAMLMGAGLGYFVYDETSYAQRFCEAPEQVSLAQLIERGPCDSSNLIVTGFVPCAQYVSESRMAKDPWLNVIIPLTTPEQDTPNGKDWPKPSAPKAIFLSNQIRGPLDLKNKFAAPQLRVRMVNGTLKRDRVTRVQQKLLDHYPGLDVHQCIILEEGHRQPLSQNVMWVMYGLAALCFVVALFLIGADLFRPSGQHIRTR